MVTEREKQSILAEYAVGNTVTLGSYNDQPIQWEVIGERGKMRLLLANRIITEQPYHKEYIDTSWRDCTLRKWLNGAFLREAFSLEERSRILNTRVDNPANPKYRTNGGFGSVDKLFALSLAEVEEYLDSDERRTAGAWWWLRSPGSNLLSAASVDKDGTVYDSGIFVHYADGGVRPAMWILLRV